MSVKVCTAQGTLGLLTAVANEKSRVGGLKLCVPHKQYVYKLQFKCM